MSDPIPSRSQTPDQQVDEVDEASGESFPASDPPSWAPLHFGPPDANPERGRKDRSEHRS